MFFSLVCLQALVSVIINIKWNKKINKNSIDMNLWACSQAIINDEVGLCVTETLVETSLKQIVDHKQLKGQGQRGLS